MKKIFAALCVLMIVPTLALANSDMVSISELRQQGEAMGRWTQTYDTPNGEVGETYLLLCLRWKMCRFYR